MNLHPIERTYNYEDYKFHQETVNDTLAFNSWDLYL